MSATPEGEGPDYWAFISYSHKDARVGRRLHRALEAYSLPRRLVGQVTVQGPLPRRLIPVFRDRDELPAASDLSSEVHAALKRSRALIVVCSPAAATSNWVGLEVEVFRKLHPGRPVLAAVIEGDPATVMPRVLYGASSSGAVEPLAADFRSEGDGKRLALLKLVAGITGLSLDTLVQRDAQRRLQRVTAVTAAALIGIVGMGVLTAFALNAKAEANRQRAEAEGLVEFMLTDLRATLKGVGRLDAMAAVNARALRYYTDQDLTRLSPDSLERRAHIFHAMGEDDETRGDYRSAMAKFVEAHRTTAAMLDAMPDNPDRIFAHAQSEFWIGAVSYAEGRPGEARPAFQAYSRLADRLLQIRPNDPRYLREKGYAEGNLCSVYLKPPKNVTAALRTCSDALKYMEAAERRLGRDGGLAEDVANRHGWLADACYANHDRACEKTHRVIQASIIRDLMRTDPKNMQLKDIWIRVQRILARIDADASDEKSALARLHDAAALSDQITAFDPSNKAWQYQRRAIDKDIAQITGKHIERTQP